MPTYLCHGFRWRRHSIIVYVVVQNLDDAAPHWITTRSSARSLIESFYNLFDFLPLCTLPLPSTSSRAGSVAGSASRSAVSRPNSTDDDDAASYHSVRSSSRSPSRSRSQSTATHHHQQQQQQQRQRSQILDAARGDNQSSTTTPTAPQSSNISRKRSEASIGGSVVPPLRGSLASHQLPHHSHTSPAIPPSSPPPLSQQPEAAAAAATNSDPVLAQAWSPVKLVEEYDPANIEEVSRPHAYVADYVTRISDSCSIVEEIQRYEARVRRDPRPPVTGPSSDEMLNGKRDTAELRRGEAGWLEQLRDELQRNEEIRWYVVVNGDEERAWPAEETVEEARSRSNNSMVQHQQYTHQLMVVEEQERDVEAKRKQLRRELGYAQAGTNRLMDDKRLGDEQAGENRLMDDKRLERRPKPPSVDISVPRDLAPLRKLRTRKSMPQPVITSPKSPKQPKTPGRGTFRKLFSRGKAEVGTPT